MPQYVEGKSKDKPSAPNRDSIRQETAEDSVPVRKETAEDSVRKESVAFAVVPLVSFGIPLNPSSTQSNPSDLASNPPSSQSDLPQASLAYRPFLPNNQKSEHV